MTVEQSYRINRDYHDPTKFRFIDNAVAEGLLIPDTRLQDIADAWESFRSMNSPLLKEMTGQVMADKLDALVAEATSDGL